MKVNMGFIDSLLRLAVGAAVISVGIYYSSWWGLLGIVPLITGSTRRCPVYVPLHLNTSEKKERE